MPTITSAFDGGNIIVADARDTENIKLEIRKDHQSDFFQWFYFRLSGARDQACKLHITNAGGASYLNGWNNYRAAISYDRESWLRIDTTYNDGVLSLSLTPEHDDIWIAYFAPYSMERHHDLIATMVADHEATLIVPGLTLDGQTIDILRFGIPSPSKKNYWVTARQHPGETMAEWWMEGFLARLTDRDDPIARQLLNESCFYVVPNMNPDGSRRGHLRTNAAGVNLNREWADPSLEKSPEVFHILGTMKETGVDFALDVHGDEALPYNFIAGAEGTPSWTEQAQTTLNSFKNAYMRASPDFQIKHGYPPSAPGKANLTICTNALAERFGCLAMTLEMPFKDTVESPDEIFGWSPARCQILGAAALDPMLETFGLPGR